MKAFKEWWKKDGFYLEYEAMCEVTWRAALEWANYGLNKFHIPEELEEHNEE